jgi:uncharacterized protein involved in cysteine biosynthesis
MIAPETDHWIDCLVDRLPTARSILGAVAFAMLVWAILILFFFMVTLR